MRLQQLPLLVQIIVILISTLVTASVEATISRDYAVVVSAVIQKSPAQIRLVWLADPDATGYQVYRKSRDAIAWGPSTTLPRTATSYTDNNVSVGTRYEYRISKTAREVLTNTYYTGHSYVYSGIEVPATEQRGKLILVVENTHSAALATELARLQQDLVGDGWQVLRRDVARTASVVTVKSVIVAAYNSDRANVEAVLLFGHVPVPYSGNHAFDGHGAGIGDHHGAWPADVFYGEMNGNWTDNYVNTTSPRRNENDNRPGDGKYDQSFLPSDVDLQVGRVDLANMSAFPKSERELLRQYLDKDHNFRHRLISVRARGLIDDPLNTYPGDVFTAGGWRNFTTFFGATGIDEGPRFNPSINFFPTLASNSYLWANGAGAGSFTSAFGIGESAPSISLNAPGIPFRLTHNFVVTDTKAVFYMLWGSFLGDWDSDNNFLRAPLATATYGLASAYAGRPHWFFHHMALGETIGYSTRLTQNNSTLYTSHGHIYTRGIHNALMGDPTLRMHIVAPPKNFVSRVTATGVSLDWDAAPGAVSGYHIYRAATAAGPFTRLNSALVTGTAFFDNDTTSGNDTYMVRAVALESSASGSYFNLSQGMFSTAAGIPTTSGLPAGLLQFSSPRYLVSEATTAGMAVITVTRSGGDNGAVSVQYATSNGTASAGADYTAVSGTLTFPNGDTSATFSVPYDNDTLVELDETVNISLSAPTGGATLGEQTNAELSIINDDELLQFDAASYSVNENEGTATITVIRTGMDTGPVEVSYSTGNGAALAGEDYTTRSGTLSFADGVTSRSFTVPIINDTEIEGDERINLTLSDPSGFSIGLGAASSATLLIIDDD